MKIILPIIFVLTFTISSYAQEMVDAIYFKSGNIVYGNIIERTDETVKIETLRGSVYLFKMEEVSKITRELKDKPYRHPDPTLLIFTSGAYTIPINDSEFSDTHDPGPGINFGAGYVLSRMFSLRLDVQYNDFPFVAGGSAISYSSTKLDLIVYTPTVEWINPYGILGGGAYFLKKGGSDNYKTCLGLSFGCGISFKLSEKEIYLFIESQYNHILINDDHEKGYIPVKFGFMFAPI
ncbi:MAG: outer membrane beta-barrel protein [Ignavibacteria bacterium]|nr:outer membrane beta-barrel protein [Ignavibacteria bacterium]